MCSLRLSGSLFLILALSAACKKSESSSVDGIPVGGLKGADELADAGAGAGKSVDFPSGAAVARALADSLKLAIEASPKLLNNSQILPDSILRMRKLTVAVATVMAKAPYESDDLLEALRLVRSRDGERGLKLIPDQLEGDAAMRTFVDSVEIKITSLMDSPGAAPAFKLEAQQALNNLNVIKARKQLGRYLDRFQAACQ